MSLPFVVVGAGPAGIAAAEVFVDAGCEVVLLDENTAPGGQGYRRLGNESDKRATQLLGASSEGSYRAFHARADAVTAKVDYRPGTTVWHVMDNVLQLSRGTVLDEIEARAIVFATGASERILPVPGWTKPGVYGLGGAQTLLKRSFAAIGKRTVFCGSSPLLYLVAAQYHRAGATVAAVLDTSPKAGKLQALPGLAARPGLLAEGLRSRIALMLAGIPVHDGVSLEAITGTEGVAGLSWRDARGRAQTTDCDAVGLGHGLRPESQLAEIAGAEMVYDDGLRTWVPSGTEATAVAPGIYTAGDARRIRGAEAALISGARAAAAALKDAGVAPGHGTIPAESALDAHDRFQSGLRKAFAWPRGAEAVAALPDDTVICRCEHVTAGTLRTLLREGRAEGDPNRVKALSRVGMGRCQGRFCGAAAIEIIEAAAVPTSGTTSEPGRLRAQPPVRPVPIFSNPEEDLS